ncbi:MAG: DNA polymerase III subunit alpha [Rickettsiales bacterium]|jgi:DNA polymerase-3 subunit alpha|nr:DNA polymerase III subunit alpha [Rickettsiales bacterium]
MPLQQWEKIQALLRKDKIKMDVQFIHLRNHSSYSLSEGAINVNKLVNLAKENQMPAVGITDTNNAFGWPNFTKLAKQSGIQPILGTQINIPIESKEKFDTFGNKIKTEKGQIVLLVQNEKGYENLTKILSKAYTENDSHEPLISWEKLKEFNDGLILLSGGINGVVGKNLSLNDFDNAKYITIHLKEIFGDRFYIEIQRHFLEVEENLEKNFIDLAYEYDIPLVATNECFFPNKDMYQAHDAFLCISQGRYADEEDRRKETPHHYFKSQEEMTKLFNDLPEAIQNTVLIAKRCGFAVPTRNPLLPHAYDTSKYSEAEILEQNSRDGLKKKLETLKLAPEEEKEYWDRLEFEIGVINKMGFPGYFLIVSDFIKWSKEHNIPVGPGRGSGAGSIVAWSLEITDLNPLKYGLLFERFLNPDRVSMPDFDIDFCQDGREEVINYVQEKYGSDKVAQIITFGQFKAKMIIRDIGRVLRIPLVLVDKVAKLVPFDPNITLKKAIDTVSDLRYLRENDENVAMLLTYAEQLEGLHRHASTHACGMVIGDRPLTQLVPLYKEDKSEMPMTQFDVKSVEDTGLVKYDFLGLKTLSIIKNTIQMIKDDGLDAPDINNLNLEDPKVFELFARGDTVGIFQFESGGMQDWLRKLQPTRFEELIAMNALYRPGPMENIPSFVNRRHGLEDIKFPHPWLEEILQPTYGIIVYQEQVMQISQRLASFTKGQADSVRKAMGKKIAKLMDEMKVLFIEGAINNGIDSKQAEEIWNLMEKFAEYGFNKSHAACYAYIAYQTAYLKEYFRPYFMAATMNYDIHDTDKLAFYFKDCKKYNINVLTPDINKSDAKFKVEDGSIRYALGAIRNVGTEAMEILVVQRKENGNFKNITDFVNRIDYKSINKRLFECLIQAGTFDSLEPNRALLIANVNLMTNHARLREQAQEEAQASLFGEPTSDNNEDFMQNFKKATKFTLSEQIKKEYEAIGFYISSHPIFSYEELLAKRKILNSSYFKTTHEGNNITVAAVIDSASFKETKAKKPMAILQLSDMEGTFDTLVFENLINRDMFKKDTPIIVSGQLKKGIDNYTIFARSIDYLDNYFLTTTFHFILQLRDKTQVAKLNEILSKTKQGNAVITVKVATSAGITTLVLPKKYQITHDVIAALKKEKIPVIME